MRPSKALATNKTPEKHRILTGLEGKTPLQQPTVVLSSAEASRFRGLVV